MPKTEEESVKKVRQQKNMAKLPGTLDDEEMQEGDVEAIQDFFRLNIEDLPQDIGG